MPTVALTRLQADEVQVTEYRIPPGESTGPHRHGYDYVIVPLTAGTLRVVEGGEEKRVPLQPGAAYFRKAGVEHDVFNGGDAPLAFIEVELLRNPG